MRNQGLQLGTPVIILSVVVVILVAGFAYDFATTTSQISNLNSQVSTLNSQVASLEQSGESLCVQLPSLKTLLSNVTSTLQSQVQSDRSIIATLNSTKPSGYSGMMATLNSQISNDLRTFDQIFSVIGAPSISGSSGNGTNPCATFQSVQASHEHT